jgi:uncharacterized protein
MQLTNRIRAIDIAIWLEGHKTLVICDTHLGYEQSMQQRGILLPQTQLQQTIDRLRWILKQVSPKRIVLNGDIKHEFGSVLDQEWNDCFKLIDFLKDNCDELLFIKGNHDPLIEPIAKKKNVPVIKNLQLGNILITHGDELPSEHTEVVIIGHEHPAITLEDGVKYEKYKCFLTRKIKVKGKASLLIAQPSFHLLKPGVDILQDKFLGPVLTTSSKGKVYIVDEKKHEVLYFGVVGEF